MKKIISIVFSVLFISTHIIAQDNGIEDNQYQLLEIFGEQSQEEADYFDALEILQESNAKTIQKNEEMIQEKEKPGKDKKKQNYDTANFLGIGYNLPFNFLNSDYSPTIKESIFPVGISAHYITSYMYISGKANFNLDFIKYTDNFSIVFGATFSLGFTPIHNDYYFIGLYGTMGIDKIGNYTYTAYGASGTLLFNLSNKLGIFINVDATYRTIGNYDDKEEISPELPFFLNSWRICPSVGISYKLF